MKNKSTTNKWIYNHSKPFIPWVILISVLNIISSIAYIILAKLSQQIIDTANNNNGNAFLVGSIMLFGFIALHILIESAVSLITAQITAKHSYKCAQLSCSDTFAVNTVKNLGNKHNFLLLCQSLI